MQQAQRAKSILKNAMMLDAQGHEREAIPQYRRAIAAGLPKSDLRVAMIGLGSSLTAMRQYRAAIRVLQAARWKYPRDVAVLLYLALAHYHAGQRELAVRQLGDGLIKESPQAGLGMFRRALARKYHACR